MAAVRGGVWRAITGVDTVRLPAIVLVHLGLLLKCSVIAVAQSQCSAGMCERPPSTVKSAPSSVNVSCYSETQSVVIFCNPGFRQSGDRYTARCRSGGVWDSDNECRIDLFSILVACSASLVAILVFFFIVLCIWQVWYVPGKRKQHTVTKAKVTKKRRADPEAANGRPAIAADHQGYQVEEIDDDFTDDEEDILPNKGANMSHGDDENVYQNQQF